MRAIHCFYLGLFLMLATGGVQAREAVTPGAIKIENVKKETVTAKPRVLLETSMGNILLELDPTKAPVSVENFMHYVKDGFYNGLIFHRVIPGFMVQGGGMKPDMSNVATRAAIKNEAKNGLSNRRGTIAMARTNDPESATAQFFINEVDNTFLDYSSRRDGYAVFGHVIEGMNVVDAIAKVKTTRRGGYSDVPEKNIVITKAEILSKSKPEDKKARNPRG